MLKRIRMIACALAVAAVAVAGLYILFAVSRSSDLLAALPVPPESRPYALIYTKDNSYPRALSSLLTDGIYARFRNGTSRNCIFAIASLAKDCAMLVEEQDKGMTEVYAALRFERADMRQLAKGDLPDLWKGAFKSPRVDEGPEKGTWALYAEDADTPIYFKAEKKRILIAAGNEPFRRLLSISRGDEKGLRKKRWKEESSWPGHVELSDGGRIMSGKDGSPLKLQVAWHKLDGKKASEPEGEAKWTIDGLDKKIGPMPFDSLEPTQWDPSLCVVPKPLLMSVGINMPELKGSPKEWPFPLDVISELARGMELSDRQIRRMMRGKTIFSLGGQNRILWFSLPGFTVEFTGERRDMEELVSAFWDKLFYGAEPKPLEGFEYGGAANVPFSVIAAGRANMALLGMTSPESIKDSDEISKFLKGRVEAIGWLVADLPRIGAALSEMTKMSSLAEESYEADKEGNDNGADAWDEGTDAGPFAASPFDQSITDSFGNVLRGLGKVSVIWEKPASGRINWYSNSTK